MQFEALPCRSKPSFKTTEALLGDLGLRCLGVFEPDRP